MYFCSFWWVLEGMSSNSRLLVFLFQSLPPSLHGRLIYVCLSFCSLLITTPVALVRAIWIQYNVKLNHIWKDLSVVPDVQIPEWEERRGPRQCTGKKGKFITDWSQGPLPHPTQWCRSESPEPKLLHKFIGWAHALGLSGLVTSLQSNFIGQNFCAGGIFIPNFLIDKQWSVLSES